VRTVEEIIRANKREKVFIGIVWLIAFAAILFSYFSGEMAKLDKGGDKKCECVVYVPTNGSIIFSECENDLALTD
jgi:hypothetical protein